MSKLVFNREFPVFMKLVKEFESRVYSGQIHGLPTAINNVNLRFSNSVPRMEESDDEFLMVCRFIFPHSTPSEKTEISYDLHFNNLFEELLEKVSLFKDSNYSNEDKTEFLLYVINKLESQKKKIIIENKADKRERVKTEFEYRNDFHELDKLMKIVQEKNIDRFSTLLLELVIELKERTTDSRRLNSNKITTLLTVDQLGHLFGMLLKLQVFKSPNSNTTQYSKIIASIFKTEKKESISEENLRHKITLTDSVDMGNIISLLDKEKNRFIRQNKPK